MSTYWYYECRDHSPPLRSSDEVSQYTDDEYWQHAAQMLQQRPVDPDWENDYWRTGDTGTYFTGHAHRFLRDHPSCRVVMVSEAGQYRYEDGSRGYAEPPAQ